MRQTLRGPRKPVRFVNRNSWKTSKRSPMVTKKTVKSKSSYDFPVDIVFTWVNGRDPVHQQKRISYLPEAERKDASSIGSARFEDHDELRYALRSIGTFAPWARNVFVIVDDCQIPSWINEKTVKVITHSKLFGAEFSADLPVFNSHALEVHLHRIPGLSEQFIYMNDDMFFTNKVRKADFFTPQGKPRVRLGQMVIPRKIVRDVGSYMGAWMKSHDLLESQVARNTPRLSVLHQAKPFTKSTFEQLWSHSEIGDQLKLTSASKFRHDEDVAMFILASMFLIMTNTGIHVKRNPRLPWTSSLYIALFSPLKQAKHFEYVLKKRPHMFCCNDIMKVPPSKSERVALASFFNRLFPFIGPYETWIPELETIYVISIKKERYNLCMTRLRGLARKVEYVNSLDGSFINADKWRSDGRVEDKDYGPYTRGTRGLLTRGEIGCYVSHMNAYKQLLESDNEHALILEDDANFAPTHKTYEDLKLAWAEIKENGVKWDVLYLGRGKYSGDIPVSPHIVKVSDSMGLHAYVVNRKAAQYFVDNCSTIKAPIDVEVTRSWHTDLNRYAVTPNIIGKVWQGSDTVGIK